MDLSPRNRIWKVAGGNQARGCDAADLDTAIAHNPVLQWELPLRGLTPGIWRFSNFNTVK